MARQRTAELSTSAAPPARVRGGCWVESSRSDTGAKLPEPEPTPSRCYELATTTWDSSCYKKMDRSADGVRLFLAGTSSRLFGLEAIEQLTEILNFDRGQRLAFHE